MRTMTMSIGYEAWRDRTGNKFSLVLYDKYSTNVDLPSSSQKSFQIYVDPGTVVGTNQGVQGASLTLALRELDYCDKDGNEYKILALATEPYSEEQ